MPLPLIVPILIAATTGATVHTPKKLKNIGVKKKSWLDSFMATAKVICKKNGVPYQMCVTQAALESGWGEKAPKFNHFGIKGEGSAGFSSATGKEFVGGQYVSKVMKFAAYSSLEDAIQSYCNAMKDNPKFKYATENFSNDLNKFIIWIWGKGYATSPDYVYTFFGVMSVIYRATGNEDFNKQLTAADKLMIKKLRGKVAGSKRAALTESLLKDATV
jgi:flagellum-specific peptidoglycan hydrolase FlgJ